LPENPQVQYERSALEQARTVAAIPPSAIARIEALHGRRVAFPYTIKVLASPGFAATGLGIPEFVGTASLRHLTLSPVCSLPSARSCSNGVGGQRRGRRYRVSSAGCHPPPSAHIVLENSGSPLNPATFEDLQDTPKRTGRPDFFVSFLHDSDPVGISTNRGLDFARSAVFRCSRRSLCN
jgi:hypothetical protein